MKNICERNFYQLLRIRQILETLVFRSIFPFYSICQLFCVTFFYIAVCLSVILHTASKSNHRYKKHVCPRVILHTTSKWNHRYKKQKEYGLVISKHSWNDRPRISKNTGGIKLFLMQTSYWNSYCYCYWNSYWNSYC